MGLAREVGREALALSPAREARAWTSVYVIGMKGYVISEMERTRQ